MIQKILLAFLLFFITPFLYGQNNIETEINENEFLISSNYSFLTTGDQKGVHIINEYKKSLSQKINVVGVFGFLHSVKESGILSIDMPSNYNHNVATGDWGFTSEDGIKILDLKTDQQTYIHLDIKCSYELFNFNNFEFEISAGGSVAYINNNFITRWELGTFIGESTGEQDLQLVYPYYSRIIDIGICGSMNINYKISDSFIIGITSGLNNYPKSGYRFYDIVGLKGGIRF